MAVQYAGKQIVLSGEDARSFREWCLHPDIEVPAKRDRFLQEIENTLNVQTIDDKTVMYYLVHLFPLQGHHYSGY